jgi:methionyl-tRNA formyltransferase
MTKPSIVIVTDNPASWSVAGSRKLVDALRADGCTATLVHAVNEAPDADIAVYLSCERIVSANDRARFRHNLVAHASDLPRGRGWSPMTWRSLEGADRLTVTLFEAVDDVDAGDVYAQAELTFEGHELIEELRAKLDAVIHDLVLEFARQWPNVTARPHQGEPSFYARRRPQDSRLDPDKSLRDNFNLLRVVDNERYPAFFEHAGHVYELRITKRGPVG